MIKITTELKTSTGFKSSISVLEINSYTITETIQLTSGSTFPAILVNGKNINVNFSIYKSASDKLAGALPYLPVDFPFNFSNKVENEDELNEGYLYSVVETKLNLLGFNTEIV